MPLYDYQCGDCSHTFERTLKISDMKIPESEACPSCGDVKVQKRTFTAPGLGDPVRLGLVKPGGDFKEVLAKIHERNYKSNLNALL